MRKRSTSFSASFRMKVCVLAAPRE